MTDTTDRAPRHAAGEDLGRLAELAARGDARSAMVEDRIAAALAVLGTHPAGLGALIAAAGDAARPLSRRVGVLALLHRALEAGPGPDTDR